MRTIIAGSRGLSYSDVAEAMQVCGWVPTVVISGTARGVDESGEIWAAHKHIPVERFPADWKLHGKRAGIIRNQDMADRAEALVAVWDGNSRGTANMIGEANKRRLRVFVYNPLVQGAGHRAAAGRKDVGGASPQAQEQQ